MPPKVTWKVVYAVVDRGPRTHWLRVGVAFVNRDGSLNVRLDALPVNGQLQIRDPPRSPEGGESFVDVPNAPAQPAQPASPRPAVLPGTKRRP